MDFKIAFLVIVAMVTAYLGFNSYVQETNTNPLSSLSLPEINIPSTGLFTKFINKDYTNVNIEANLTFSGQNSIHINPRNNIQYINITYQNSNNIIRLDGMYFKTQEPVTIIIKDLKGEVDLSSLISFKGYSQYATVNGITFTNKNNLFYSSADNLTIHTIDIKGIPKIDFRLNSVSGKIIITNNGDSVLYTITGKPLEIEDYEGNIYYDGNVLKLKGKGNIKSSTIITPKTSQKTE